MKSILLSLVLLFNFFIFPQSPEIKHSSDYNDSRLPLGYGTNHSGTSGSGVWTELQPGVPRVDYWRVYFVNPDTGLAVGDMGAIIKTTNGGQHWYTIENNFNVSIKALGSYSGNPIFAAGGHGLIIKSTDYGESWTVVPINSTKNFWNIEFIDQQNAWLVGEDATAYKTTDGGESWVSIITPLVYSAFFDVSFLDTKFGYIGANDGYVLRTSDGGENWSTTYVYDIYGLLTIKAVSRQKAVALGYAGKQINTTDGGESWHLTTYLGSILTDMAFIDSLKGFAVGVSGGFETTDGGENWELRMDMMDGIGISFANSETGYMLGMDLVNQKTTDGGESWERMIVNDEFTDVYFTDENHGWFIGNQKIYQTSDGSNTLIERDDFPGDRPSSVYFLDSLTGIVGAMNKIFKTTDGGLTWSEKNISGISGNALEFFRLFFINDHIGWAAGRGGYAIKTIDAGENWTSKLNIASIEGIFLCDSLTAWVTRGGKPLKTTDGGESWIEITSFPASSSRDAFFIDSINGFVSRTNELYKTSNGGINWELTGVTDYLYGRFSNLKDNLFMAGVPRTYNTTDLGEYWDEIMDLRDKSIRYIRLSEINRGYAVGDNGLIIGYLDTLITPVELNSFKGTILKRNNIFLEWSTSTETNNKGFEIERSEDEQTWIKVGFINGTGNSTEINNYKFTDKIEKPGLYFYRLKQIDYDGSFNFSNIIATNVSAPSEFRLNQNYPNPFNPETTIEFEIPETEPIRLTVYNLLGERVKELVNGKLEPGYYNYTFNGAHYSSGTYIYTLESKNQIESRKMILLK